MNRLPFYALVAALALAPLACARAEATLIVGEVADQEFNKDVTVPCPENHVCMSSWFRWKLDVDHVVDGPPLKGRLVVANMQHAYFTVEYLDKLTCFMVRPLEDAELRQRLQADYVMLDRWKDNESGRPAACDLPAQPVLAAPPRRLPHRD